LIVVYFHSISVVGTPPSEVIGVNQVGEDMGKEVTYVQNLKQSSNLGLRHSWQEI